MWLLYAQLLGEQNRYRFVLAIMINPPVLPIKWWSSKWCKYYKYRCAAVL